MASIKFIVEGTDKGRFLLSSLMHDESFLASKAKSLVVAFEGIDEELAHWLISNINAHHTVVSAVHPDQPEKTPIKEPVSSHETSASRGTPAVVSKQPSSEAVKAESLDWQKSR